MGNLRQLNNFVLLPIGITVILCIVFYQYNDNEIENTLEEKTAANIQDELVFETEPKPLVETEAEAMLDPEEQKPSIGDVQTEVAPPPVLSPGEVRNSPGTITGSVDGRTYAFEVRRTPEERAQGLSGRSGLADNEGMLFIFDYDARHGFWMKDMLFALDIIWLDADMNVVHAETDVSPDTYPRSFVPTVPARYVLEINAGTYKNGPVSFALSE